MQIKRFTPKPPVIEAAQYDIANGPEIVDWSGGHIKECETLEPSESNPSGAFLTIGNDVVFPGDWVVRHQGSRFFLPVRNTEIERHYDEV